ncbi:tetratricopeptide repeat protein [Paenibacillus sp. WC2504]|uniref:tetratricopeptide repeat protein n=1 Tax=Paenibacillus sp. WC2504 TaxID=3461403 RepID=UPI004045A5B6
MAAITILAKIAPLFLGFVMPRVKNSKLIRDLHTKWTQDNYSSKVKAMFTAAYDDSKALYDLPDELLNDLLGDKVNREEVFRWIVEGVPAEHIETEKLNLLPYMELYPRYQDMLLAFFITINSKIHDFKDSKWDPEFLQILSSISSLEQEIKEGITSIQTSQSQILEKFDVINAYFEPVSISDLNDLIKSGEVKTARERALERLNKKPLSQNELMELNAAIGSCYFLNGQEKEAIPYLHASIVYCQDVARKNRITSLIHLFEGHYDEALRYVNLAIEKEGFTQRNLENLINIYSRQGQYRLAIEMIEEHSDLDLKELNAFLLINDKKYDLALDLTNNELITDPDNFTWLLMKCEIQTLMLDSQVIHDQIVNTDEVYKTIMPILNKLEKLDKQNDNVNMRIKELKAAIAFRNQHFAEAKVFFEWVYNHKQENREFTFRNFLSCCLCDQDWGKSIELLTGKIDANVFEINDITTLGRVYIDSGEPELAKSLFEEKRSLLNMQTQSALKYYFVYLDSLMQSLNHSQIETFIQTLEAEHFFEVGIQCLKAYYATIVHDWNEAVILWESCINHLDGEVFAEAATNLSQAYVNRGSINDFEKVTELIVRIPYWRHHEPLINRYVRGLYEIGEYEKIIQLYHESPTDNRLLSETVTSIYYDFGWFDIAKDNYMVLFQKTNDIEYLCRYANCLYRSGFTDKCLEMLNSIEKRIKEKPSLGNYQLMCVSYLSAHNYSKAMDYAYKMFELAKDNPDVWRFYFMKFLQITQNINEPLDEWVQAYQYVCENFTDKFPSEDPLFTPFKIMNEDNIISEEFLNQLKGQSESIERATQVVQENKLPPSFMAEFLGKGPYETWMHFFNSADLDFWVLQDNIEVEIEKGLQVAADSKGILCDPSILLTLRQLNLLDVLALNYTLYIHQDSFNKLFEEFIQKKAISEKGHATLAYIDGKIIHTENSMEHMNAYISQHEEFINWINANCEKVGNKISNKEKDERMAFLQSPIESCSENGINMMVDSYVVRKYARDNYGVESFNVYEWLFLMFVNGKIINEKFLDSFGELLNMGYTLLPINAETLIHHLHANNYLISDKISKLLGYLRRAELSHEYAIDISSKVLKWIWLESMPTNQRHLITDMVCEVITFQKNKNEVIKQLLAVTKSIFPTLVQHQYIKLEQSVHSWLQSQHLI